VLEIENLTINYGTETAVNKVSLSVSGEVVSLCGRNGAGKSSLLKAVAGIVKPASGDILLDGESIKAVPLHKRLGKGIGYVPEERRLFEDLTVKQNIKIARLGAQGSSREETGVTEILPDLKSFYNRKSKLLSGGQQKMVNIARAIVTSPKVLLFDELLEGLAQSLTINITDSIKKIKAQNRDILCAESSIEKARRYADRVIWLERGEIVTEGTPEEVQEEMEKAIMGT